MIQGFATTLGQDFDFAVRYFKGQVQSQPSQPWQLSPEQRIFHVAIRALAALTMGSALLNGFLAGVALSPIEAGLTIAFCVAKYVLMHDVFVISRNLTTQTDNLMKGFFAEVRASWDNLKDMCQGTKPKNFGMTEGTICRSLWNDLLIRYMS